MRLDGSSEQSRKRPTNETDQLLDKITDVVSTGGLAKDSPPSLTSDAKDAATDDGPIKAEPVAATDSTEPVKSDTSVSCFPPNHDYQDSSTVVQQSLDSVHVADNTASRLSHVCD